MKQMLAVLTILTLTFPAGACPPGPVIDELWGVPAPDGTWVIFGHVDPMPAMAGQPVYLALDAQVFPFRQDPIGGDGFFFATELDFGSYQGPVWVWTVDPWGQTSPAYEVDVD